MKKIFPILLLIFVYVKVNAQYIEDAVLFSTDQILGNAKNQGMSGVTGALGGDISGASELNPAGIALTKYPNLYITAGLHTNSTKSQFEDASQREGHTFFNFSQVGATFVFKSAKENQPWKGFAFGINHQKTGYFDRDYSILSPSNDIIVNRVAMENDQEIEVETTYNGTEVSLDGRASKFSFTLGSNYRDVLYLGFGVHWHSVIFNNTNILYEIDDRNQEISFENQNRKTGNGFSLSIGAIVKPTEQIRLGLSYQSPVWYSFVENNFPFNSGEPDPDQDDLIDFEYDLIGPTKITASGAFILQDIVSIGIDYQFKQYKNVRYKPSSDQIFGITNTVFSEDVNNTSSIGIGGELKLEEWFIRAGYRWEESPTGSIQNFQESEPIIVSNLRGDLNQYSFGVGYKFSSGFQVDLAYVRRMQERQLVIYPTDQIPLADVNYSDSNVSVSLNWHW